MRIDLSKMQKKVDKVMDVFNNIVKELSTQIGELDKGIESNNQIISTAVEENKLYAEKIKEYETLKHKVESIIK
jgi:hypothetical protein